MSNTVREKLEAYFASLNSTSNRMMADIISSRKEYYDRWENMTPDEQSEILWQSIVKPDAVNKYKTVPAKSLDVEYFPVLRTRPGEKIIVDEDSASAKSFVSGSTWQDEHSAPFRWETQSQLEFRFNEDSEPEKEKQSTLERETPKYSPKITKSDSPKSIKSEHSPKPVRSDDNPKILRSENSPKAVRSEKSPKVVRSENSPKTIRSESPKAVRSENSPKTIRSESPKAGRCDSSPKSIRSEKSLNITKAEKQDSKKEDEIKRHTVKRPEVPPPPVPPHATSPVLTHSESPPVPPHTDKSTKDETPIYAKVVKRKSSAKTLVISEMKAHRKAKEEMKPAVPPRMSLELKGDVDLSKFKVQDIDIDGIPKTGFDFLDNW